ncbi:phosphoglycerate kinase [Candidatus Saccharibacteria bacterium]|nr:phosphoglycerate kinase [Candidatus Saccharibacteria bacterium]
MNFLTVKDVKLRNQIVLVRVDYNVPLDEQGNIISDFRIRASLPTLKFLKEKGARKIILLSHLGRPDGKKVKELSLKPVAFRLAELLPEEKVEFVDDVSGPDVEDAVNSLKKGGILLLENLRFYPGEEKNSDDFIREIIDSTGADIYVQDGFAVIHRAHASTSAVAKHLPVYAGLLLEKEISALDNALKSPKKPLTLVLGGAKVEEKTPLISAFSKVADKILVGGKIAADGLPKEILENPALSEKLYVAEDFDEDSAGNKLDIGPLATAKFADVIKASKTVIWNGLLGKAEDTAFSTGSEFIAKTLGETENINSIILGGDTTGFIENLLEDNPDLKYSLLSTGGGAALEFLSGNSLPGLEVVETAVR